MTVLVLPPISSSSSPLTLPLGTVSNPPFIIGFTVTFMFHRIFSTLARYVLILLSFSFIFTEWFAGSRFCFVLVDLNNGIVWLVFTHPLISKSSCTCTKPLETVPSASITIGITVTFMFHSFFFCYLARSRYLALFPLYFSFTLWSAGTAKSKIRQVFFFLLTIT